MCRSQTAALHPGCIVKPTTPREVSIAVGIARLTNSKFAVRSGGHNASPGFANIDEGLLISMENLNEVSYNETAGNAVIGAGNRWGDVYRELDPYNVTVVGGRVPDVGVGGLILGGEFVLDSSFLIAILRCRLSANLPRLFFCVSNTTDQSQAVFRTCRIAGAWQQTTWRTMR